LKSDRRDPGGSGDCDDVVYVQRRRVVDALTGVMLLPWVQLVVVKTSAMSRDEVEVGCGFEVGEGGEVWVGGVGVGGDLAMALTRVGPGVRRQNWGLRRLAERCCAVGQAECS
jgi:hypothetical protein